MLMVSSNKDGIICQVYCKMMIAKPSIFRNLNYPKKST